MHSAYMNRHIDWIDVRYSLDRAPCYFPWVIISLILLFFKYPTNSNKTQKRKIKDDWHTSQKILHCSATNVNLYINFLSKNILCTLLRTVIFPVHRKHQEHLWCSLDTRNYIAPSSFKPLLISMINCKNSLLIIKIIFVSILVIGVPQMNFFQRQSTTCKWTTVTED